MASMKPLHDRVVVECIEAEEKTESGILLPSSATEKPDVGMVVAVGDGRVLADGTKLPLCVKVKDKVVFGKYAGQKVKLDGKEYTVMREEDIFAIITE